MGKQRKEHPQDSIFANNPFLDGLFDWMDLPEGQQCIAVRDVLWDLLEDVQLDAKQRKLIWPDAEPLDLEQSIQRIQKEYPDFPPARSRSSCSTGSTWATTRKTTPRRNSTSSTASQNGGSPTTFERQRHQKSRRELVTLENYAVTVNISNPLCYGIRKSQELKLTSWHWNSRQIISR